MKNAVLRRSSAALAALALAFVAFAAQAETLTWDVSVAGGEWSNAANWKIGDAPAGRIPQEGDDVVFPKRAKTNVKIKLGESTPQLSSLTIWAGWTLSVSGWSTCIRATTVTVTGHSSLYPGTISPSAAFTNDQGSNRVWIVAKDLTVDTYGRIDANGLGYKAMNGPAWAGVTKPGSASYCGGAYGGNQTWNVASASWPKTYGSVKRPLDPGSGASSDGSYPSKYGTGGGAILIELTGALVVNGKISADGLSPWTYCGGGSGGGICVTCKTISGKGQITADSPYYTPTKDGCGSGGGGGRVAIAYDASAQDAILAKNCTVRFSANGGCGGGSATERQTKYGEGGSVWFTDQRFFSRATLNMGGVLWYGDEPTEVTSLAFTGNLLINNGTTANPLRLEFAADGASLSVAGNLGITGTISRASGVMFRGEHSKLTVGKNAGIKGGSIWATDGVEISIAGGLSLADGTFNKTCGELVIYAGPTNDVNGLKYGATVDIGGSFDIAGNSAFIPTSDPKNGAVVKLTAGSLNLGAKAELQANEAGYAAKCGPSAMSSDYNGASHGGRGGSWSFGKVGKTYGRAKMPVCPGTGGGSASWSGNGGGAILVETTGDMVLNGTVTANGHDGRIYGGAAAGGSIFLKCGRLLSGSPVVISADGGSCDEVETNSHGCAGGGGRIAIWYQKLDFDPKVWNVHASGGVVKNETEDTGHWGEDGSVCWRKWNQGLIFLLR